MLIMCLVWLSDAGTSLRERPLRNCHALTRAKAIVILTATEFMGSGDGQKVGSLAPIHVDSRSLAPIHVDSRLGARSAP